MDTIKLWARNGDAVRQAIELGELVHLETASEELTDEFLLFAIQSGLLTKWADAFPDPRSDPEIRMEVILASHLAARFAGLYSMRKSGYVLRSASVLGALGYSVDVLEPDQGVSLRGTADDKLISGDVLRKLLVKLENHVDLGVPVCLPPIEPSQPVKVRQRASVQSKVLSTRTRWRLVRSGQLRSSWSGITTMSVHRFCSMPGWAKAVASILWTPRTWRCL
jgi:hypothetical protein